jgi:hypothetical protein
MPASYGDGHFIWPLNGAVISTFGSVGNGERNDGINIAAKMGEPIHAAAGGTVTYAGNELKGYGNLILIRHDDGYVTAYAHAQSIGVNRGDHVEKGQVIGLAAVSTGDVDSPQLHFEIRRGVEPVDPKPLLMADRASVTRGSLLPQGAFHFALIRRASRMLSWSLSRSAFSSWERDRSTPLPIANYGLRFFRCS